ncbi:MAG: radical SAM protein, partial [Thermodesulfobacteriota bacterium]
MRQSSLPLKNCFRLSKQTGPPLFLWKTLLAIYNLPLLLNPKIILKLKKLTPWLTNTTRIEIEVMTNCTLSCFNCNRSVRQAPANEYMSLEQIEKFVTESIEQNWRWELINLIGGEPTLHPQLCEILKKIREYKDFNP